MAPGRRKPSACAPKAIPSGIETSASRMGVAQMRERTVASTGLPAFSGSACATAPMPSAARSSSTSSGISASRSQPPRGTCRPAQDAPTSTGGMTRSSDPAPSRASRSVIAEIGYTPSARAGPPSATARMPRMVGTASPRFSGKSTGT